MFRKWLPLIAILVFAAFQYPVTAQESSLPTRDELREGWNQLDPGGETVCSRGTPYSFFVHPADSDKVLIHFQGGGACWNENNCSIEDATFQDRVSRLEPDANLNGILDTENEQNPVADYNMVIVSYCTGDIHTGNQTVEYSDDLTIEHKGRINSEAVLDWVFKNYDNPSDVLVTGCSAGAYGAIYFAGDVMEQYPDIQVRVLGDSGVGVAADQWEGLDIWNTFEGIADDEWRTIDPTDGPSNFTNQLYLDTARQFPNNIFAQYTTAADGVQTFFYFFQGGGGWPTAMREGQERLNEELPNYYSFIAGGDQHCVLPTPGFYDFAANGVAFIDWFTDLVNNQLTESITCDDCEEMELISEPR